MAAPLPNLPFSEKKATIHPGDARLDDAPIAQQYKDKLKKLGYITLEQVISVSEMAPVRARLSEYLGQDVTQVLAQVPKRVIAPQLSFLAKTAKYKFGARLKQPVTAVLPRTDLPAAQHVPFAKTAMAPPASPLGSQPEVNLGGPAGQMPPVRDQAYRGTCVAHAAVACFEQYLIARGQATPNSIDLSEQFLYWDCKSHDGSPNQEGTYLAIAVPLLFNDGCCLESVWPYNPNPIPGNEGQGPPPAAAAADAASRKSPGAKQLSPSSVQDIKDELAQGRCVAVSVAVYDYCWMTDQIRSTGNVTMPFPGDVTSEGHAICLVGYEDLDGEPDLGGGHFILRNSWNGYWGVNCEFGIGYGTLPYAYLTTYGSEAYSIV